MSTLRVLLILAMLLVPVVIGVRGVPAAPPSEKVSTEAIELAPGLEISYYRFVDTGISRHDNPDRTTALLGEMRNLTDQSLDAPGFRFVLFDKDGNIVGSINANPLFTVIGPGQSMPFGNAIFGNEPLVGTWDSETIEICGEWPSDRYASQLPSLEGVEIVDVKVDGELDWIFRVSGKVLNGTETSLDGIWVKAAIYDAEGRYSGDKWTYVDYMIPPGKTAPFDLGSISPIDAWSIAGDSATYEITAGYSSSWGKC